MPNAKNQEMLASIKQDMEGQTAIFIVDYCGLTVKDIQELRRSIRGAGGSMKVYKNSLMRIALTEAGLPTLDDLLQGPSAFVFGGEDFAATAKVVKEYAKTNQKLEIKGGLLEGKEISAEQVDAVASLPTRPELIAQIAGAISGIARGLAVSISGVSRGLALATQAVADQKKEQEAA